MSFDPDEEPQPRKRSSKWLLIFPLIVILSALGLWLWQRYDPFFMNRPDMQEANRLLGSARNRPLTEEEFERAIVLLDAETPAAQLSAIATLEADVVREPSRRDRAVAALERCQQTASPAVRQAAGQSITRLKVPQKQP